MIGVALKGLAGRKIRALLTAFAVVIGVSMVSGTFILTDTMQKSFNGLFDASFEKTDAVIRGKEIVKDSFSGSGVTIPESVLTKVRALPEVEAASGDVSPQEANTADIIGKDGKAVARESSGVSYDAANARFSPLKLKTGEWPEGAEQVVIDAGTAAKEHYRVGDTVKVATGGQTRPYELTGIVSFGDVDSLGFASIAAWDVKTAQTLLDREGRFDSVSIAAKPGTSAAELVKAVQPLVPKNLEVNDSAAQAKDGRRGARRGHGHDPQVPARLRRHRAARRRVRDLQHPVDHRRAAHARVRHAADARRLAQAGHALGRARGPRDRPAGLGDRARARSRALQGHGRAVQRARRRPARRLDGRSQSRTVIVSLLLGTGITLLASILPAKRATRVPPIAAVREGATLPTTRMAAHSHNAGLGVTLASLAAISLGIFAGGVSAAAVALLLGGGVLGLFVGIALLAPRLVKPLARVVGWPARRAGGVAGELAGANAVRNPGRTASTAAALMIGLTLVTVVAVLGAGFSATTREAVSDQVRADHVIDGDEGLGFRASEGDALASVPGVTNASHVRSDTALVQGEEGPISGIDPATIADFYKFEWSAGSERSARPARDRRRRRDQGLRRERGPEGRRSRVAHHARGRGAHAGGPRDLRPAAGQAAAGPDQHDPAGLRRGVHAAEEQLHVHRRGRRARPRRWRPRRRDSATPTITSAPSTRRTPPRRWPRCWRCSTCCWASRSS